MSVMEAPVLTDAAPAAAKSNRVALLALAVVGVVLLAGAVFFVPKLLSGGTKDAESAVVPKHVKPTVTAPVATAKPKAKAKAKPAPVHNPFKPLYTAPVATGGAAGAPGTTTAATGTTGTATGTTGTTTGTTGTTTGTTGTTTGTTGTTTTTGTTPGTTTGTTTTTTGTTPGTTTTTTGTTVVGTRKISLLAVATTGGKLRASTTVNNVLYTPAAGETFAKAYKLVSLSGSCGTYLYGDQKFALCVGQYIIH